MLKKKVCIWESNSNFMLSQWFRTVLDSRVICRGGKDSAGLDAMQHLFLTLTPHCVCHSVTVMLTEWILGRNFCAEKRLLCPTAAYSHNARIWGTTAGRLPRVWRQPRLKTKTQSPKSKKKINAKENLFLIKVCVPGDCQLFFYDSIEGLNGA